MAIPTFQTIMRPLMELAISSGNESIAIKVAYEKLADQFNLTAEERAQLNPSGTMETFSNRVAWAQLHLVRAGLLERSGRGKFQVTDVGKTAMVRPPARIDMKWLLQFESYRHFRKTRRSVDEKSSDTGSEATDLTDTPDERIDAAYEERDAALRASLLERVRKLSPKRFEKLVLELMEKMGYGGKGSSHHLGQSNDGGVDGVINQDMLGLDTVYLQAKRYAADNPISSEQINNFLGALVRKNSERGVFVTTSDFTKNAREAHGQGVKRLVLINGEELAVYMVRFGVGVRPDRTLELKKIDDEYFEDVDE